MLACRSCNDSCERRTQAYDAGLIASMNNRHIYFLAAVLTALSLSLFVYKARVLGFPLAPQEQRQVWNVEAAVSFEPGPAAVKATLRIPSLTPGFAVLDENFISRGFGISTRIGQYGREAQWAVRQANGPQTVYYRALVYQDARRVLEDTTPPFPQRAGARRAVTDRIGRL